MCESDSSRTCPSLLLLVGRYPPDQDAWAAFVDRYAPMVYGWCRAWRLQEADAEDVTQAVLNKLARQMGRFEYDPSRSFRGWLRTIVENVWRDWQADRRRLDAAGGSTNLDMLDRIEARDDLARRLEREFDLELLEEAERRVRALVTPQTWEAYRLTAVDGLPGPVVAERLGMRVAAVLKAKSNVLKRLRDAIRSLDEDPDIPAYPGPS